jgi:hypothetical protein
MRLAQADGNPERNAVVSRNLNERVRRGPENSLQNWNFSREYHSWELFVWQPYFGFF